MMLFINNMFLLLQFEDKIWHENVNFPLLFVVVKMTESEEWTYFTQLFMYFLTVNKYRFCISVIGYINMQIIGIGFKKSISVDH